MHIIQWVTELGLPQLSTVSQTTLDTDCDLDTPEGNARANQEFAMCEQAAKMAIQLLDNVPNHPELHSNTSKVYSVTRPSVSREPAG